MKKIGTLSLLVLAASCGDNTLKQESQVAAISITPIEGVEKITLQYCELNSETCTLASKDLEKKDGKFSLPNYLNAGRTYRFGVEYKSEEGKIYKTNMDKKEAEGLNLEGKKVLCGYTQETLIGGINEIKINACAEEKGEIDKEIEITITDTYYELKLPEEKAYEQAPTCLYKAPGPNGAWLDGILATNKYICRVSTLSGDTSYGLKISYQKEVNLAYRSYENEAWEKNTIPELKWNGKADLSINIISQVVWKDGEFDLTLMWDKNKIKYINSYELNCGDLCNNQSFKISNIEEKSTLSIKWTSPILPKITLTPVKESFQLDPGYEINSASLGLGPIFLLPKNNNQYNDISQILSVHKKVIVIDAEEEKPLL